MLRRCLSAFIILVIAITIWMQRSAFLPKSQPGVLTIGTNVWPGYEPLYLARDLGYYDDAIRLVEYSSATQVIRALRNNLIDIGALTLDEALLLRQHRVPVDVILVTDVSHGGDAILAKPEIESLSALRGRRIGVENTALGAYVLTRALDQANLTLTDVELVSLEVDNQVTAYSEHRIDAVVTFEPVRSILLKQGARTLFDSREIPGEIVDVLVAHPSQLQEKAGTVETLIDGWFQALQYLEEHPQDASQRMAPRLALTPEEVLASYEGLKLPDRAENRAMFGDGTASPLRDTVEKLSKVMIEANLLKSDTSFEGFLAPRALANPTP